MHAGKFTVDRSAEQGLLRYTCRPIIMNYGSTANIKCDFQVKIEMKMRIHVFIEIT